MTSVLQNNTFTGEITHFQQLLTIIFGLFLLLLLPLSLCSNKNKRSNKNESSSDDSSDMVVKPKRAKSTPDPNKKKDIVEPSERVSLHNMELSSDDIPIQGASLLQQSQIQAKFDALAAKQKEHKSDDTQADKETPQNTAKKRKESSGMTALPIVPKASKEKEEKKNSVRREEKAEKPTDAKSVSKGEKRKEAEMKREEEMIKEKREAQRKEDEKSRENRETDLKEKSAITQITNMMEVEREKNKEMVQKEEKPTPIKKESQMSKIKKKDPEKEVTPTTMTTPSKERKEEKKERKSERKEVDGKNTSEKKERKSEKKQKEKSAMKELTRDKEKREEKKKETDEKRTDTDVVDSEKNRTSHTIPKRGGTVEKITGKVSTEVCSPAERDDGKGGGKREKEKSVKREATQTKKTVESVKMRERQRNEEMSTMTAMVVVTTTVVQEKKASPQKQTKDVGVSRISPVSVAPKDERKEAKRDAEKAENNEGTEKKKEERKSKILKLERTSSINHKKQTPKTDGGESVKIEESGKSESGGGGAKSGDSDTPGGSGPVTEEVSRKSQNTGMVEAGKEVSIVKKAVDPGERTAVPTPDEGLKTVVPLSVPIDVHKEGRTQMTEVVSRIDPAKEAAEEPKDTTEKTEVTTRTEVISVGNSTVTPDKEKSNEASKLDPNPS